MTMFKKIQAYLSRDAFFKLSAEEQNERAKKTPFYKTYLSEKTIADNSPNKLDLETAKKALGLSAYKNRLKNATNQLENTSQIRQVRKNIARINTVMTIKKKA